MKYFSVLAAFLTITNWARGQADYRQATIMHYPNHTDLFDQEDVCVSSGLKCKGCCEIVLCQQNNSVWTETSLATCPDDEICINGGCFKHKCTVPAELPFICTTVGTFPDPVDCRVYHFCVPSKDDERILINVKIRCENDFMYGYNPNSTYCNDELPDGECKEYPVPICKAPLQKGALQQNPSLYYTCYPYPTDPFLLYPYQMACPNGKRYDTSCGCL